MPSLKSIAVCCGWDFRQGVNLPPCINATIYATSTIGLNLFCTSPMETVSILKQSHFFSPSLSHFCLFLSQRAKKGENENAF